MQKQISKFSDLVRFCLVFTDFVTDCRLDLFKHEIAYGYFKDLSRRAASYKVLPHKAFKIATIMFMIF